MAPDAQEVHIANRQHVLVRSAVRNMARLASLGFDRRMLEHERPLFFRVTLKANGILRRGSPHLLGPRRTMYVVAIAALYQSFVYAMMEGHFELGFLLEMA